MLAFVRKAAVFVNECVPVIAVLYCLCFTLGQVLLELLREGDDAMDASRVAPPIAETAPSCSLDPLPSAPVLNPAFGDDDEVITLAANAVDAVASRPGEGESCDAASRNERAAEEGTIRRTTRRS